MAAASGNVMRFTKKRQSEGLIKGIFLAHLILILHLFLFAALGLLVVFLGGVVKYLVWIVLGGIALVAMSAYLFYRHLRRQGKSIGDALRSPIFAGRSVEISLLGGIATLRLNQSRPKEGLPDRPPHVPMQLNAPDAGPAQEIKALALLLEQEMITPEEYTKAKQRLLGS